MTSDTGGKGSGKMSPRGRRPGPTIELKATEVAREPVIEERAADDAAREAPIPDVTAAAEPRSVEETPQTEADAAGAPPRGPQETEAREGRYFPGGLTLPLVGAIAASAAIFFMLGVLAANVFFQHDSPLDAQRSQAAGDVAERLAKIEAALAAPRAPDAGLSSRIAAVESAVRLASEQITAQQRRTEDLAALVRETRSRAEAAAASAESAQRDAAVPDGARVDVDALNQRLAALEQALKTNEAELSRRTAADERKSRLAVVASVLLGAVERGAPFTTELAAAKALSQDANALAPLEPFAAAGIPNAAILARELSALIPAMLKATESDTRRDGGFLDKLQANAERLVRIRPVGEVPGDRPVDIIARIEAKAGAADLAGVLQELAKLPPQVRAPAEDWIKKTAARNAALAAARQFSTGALAAIGKSST